MTCETTARQAKGPFYPAANRADKDTDLTSVAGRAGQAIGVVVWVEGIVRDSECKVVPDTLVEIWQACASGRYDHPNDPNTAPLDPDFQYWGRAVTDVNGYYRFKTILPGAYPADVGWIRPPHIHFRVMKRGYNELITQMYFAGERLNDDDRILRSLNESEQKSVVVDFVPNASDERQGVFDIQINRVTGA
jgi:protocatechuate 3,4-dioxygenase beta subunit